MKWSFFKSVRFLGHKLVIRRPDRSDSATIEPSEEQLNICKILERTNDHSFITGKAGTGKSVVLRYFVAHTLKKVVVVAPTGIAALNVKGQTIHSLFKLPTGFVDLRKLTIHDDTKQLLSHIDTVVIDEISMVRADTLDGIERILRAAKGHNIPFGGVQIIAFGDLYQLPPIVETVALRRYFSEVYKGPYFFNASVWNDVELQIHELMTVFRQSDMEFKRLLDNIRSGRPTQTDFQTLQSRIISKDSQPHGNSMILTSTNAAARAINAKKLEQLKKKSRTYHATVLGKSSDSSFPTEKELTLKIGAQVVLLKNDPDKRWVNGTLATIKSLSRDRVWVRIGKKVYEVGSETWEKSSYYYNEESDTIEQEVIGSFIQLPLKLAWAITIHKSQGCTYSQVVVDLRDGAFAHGQTYVALSRCRSLQGLYLLGEIKPKDIIVEPAITSFMQRNYLRAI